MTKAAARWLACLQPLSRNGAGPRSKSSKPSSTLASRRDVRVARYSRLFNGISSVGPLMGLLGTVLGMIASFNAITSNSAMGKAELLAGGIGQAC